MDTAKPYTPLTPKMALDLAAPHTWPAAIMPAFVALCAAADAGPVSAGLALAMLAIVILMQSAVNTFNDYYDYVKGTDDADAAVAEDDAVLVYNNVNPKAVLALAIAFLACAFALGVLPVLAAGWMPLAIAAVGALCVVAYSAGSSPLSYLPLGEAVSGIVMGGLIPLAYYYVLTLRLDPLVLLWAVPEVIGVGLTMMTNNVSDIERDTRARRRTLPVLLGRQRTVALYRALLVLWLAAIAFDVIAFFTNGWMLLPFAFLAAYPQLKALFANSFEPNRRLSSMPQILSLNLTLGAFYGAAILAAGIIPLP